MPGNTRTTKVPFKVSARAGKLLGRENFSNPEGAITELVKNSYDADAENCLVIFDVPVVEKEDESGAKFYVPDSSNSNIFIIDNGEGMESSIVEKYWMQIGTGNKEDDYLSEKSRIKTGAKGIGRFALDRLGFETEMWTLAKSSDANNAVHWKMDWNQFDTPDKTISDIHADITITFLDIEEKVRELLGQSFDLNSHFEFKHGTILKISKLKDEWFPRDIKGVYTSLEALVPPRQLNIPFNVYFKHKQDPKGFGDVNTAFFNDFDYQVSAKFNAEDLTVQFDFIRNELNLDVLNKRYRNVFANLSSPYDLKTIEEKAFHYEKPVAKILNWELDEAKSQLLRNVGSFQFSFNYLKLINSRKEGYPYNEIIAAERKATLERFGGVKIYRDSFRVRPYGDPGSDWLGLGFRAAKSPAGAGQRIGDWRVNSESLAGIITISRKSNPLLIDKSDRGALQENDSFDTLKRIVVAIIHEFEVDRSRILNPIYLFNKKEEQKKEEDRIRKKAEELARKIVRENQSPTHHHHLDETVAYKGIVEETLRGFVNQEKEDENREIVQVRSLASLGLVVSSFAHELKEVSNNSSEIDRLEQLFKSLVASNVKSSPEYSDGIDILSLLQEDSEKIRHWVDYSLTAIRKDKRTRTSLDVAKFLNQLKASWKRIFKRKDIDLTVINHIGETKYEFRAFEMDMTTVFSNLINNSIDSFEQRTVIGVRSITIDCAVSGNRIEINYSDNGKGLDSVFENKEDIFLPFTTSKRDRKGNEIGTGLGMYLVRSVIDANNGNIEIVEQPVGFAVKISFPIIFR